MFYILIYLFAICFALNKFINTFLNMCDLIHFCHFTISFKSKYISDLGQNGILKSNCVNEILAKEAS